MKRNREIAKKYAAALVSVATETDLLEVAEQQLELVRNTVRTYSELRGFLFHPMLAREAKKEVIENIFGKRLEPIVMRFLDLVIERGRVNLLDDIVDLYVQLSREARNVQEAQVTAAVELTEEEENELVQRLQALTGKQVYLKTTIDPQLLGGLVVTIGDRRIDGSMARQLEEMKATLLQDTNGLR